MGLFDTLHLLSNPQHRGAILPIQTAINGLKAAGRGMTNLVATPLTPMAPHFKNIDEIRLHMQGNWQRKRAGCITGEYQLLQAGSFTENGASLNVNGTLRGRWGVTGIITEMADMQTQFLALRGTQHNWRLLPKP